MTVKWTVYDSTSGEILRTGEAMTVAQANLQGNTPGTKVVVVGSDPVAQKVDISNPSAPVVSARLPMTVNGTQISASKTSIIANGIDSATISPVPNGATYLLTVPSGLGIAEYPIGTINDGSLVLTTTVPGIYTLLIQYGTNLDFTVTINAT